MKAAGCEVKTGKHLAFKAPGQQRFIRCDSLGDDYSESAIRERISGKRVVAPKQKVAAPVVAPPRPNLLIDIQNNIKALQSPAYAQKLKVINIKEMAKTVIFLQDRGLTDYDALCEKAAAASKLFGDTGDRLKVIETRQKEIASLQKHIGAYGKTLDVYRQYRDGGWNKKFYAKHEQDITIHKAAKKAFDELGLKKLPTVKTLQTEYATLDAEKKKLYQGYRPAREEMIALLMAKQNVERILGMTSMPQKSHEKTGQEL